VTYGGGGSGALFNSATSGAAGAGGGGKGNNTTPSGQSGSSGTAGTGGGGGSGGSGGSGVVILRSLFPASATTGSPTASRVGVEYLYTFSGAGSITY
jgi:hypothetical protein